MVSKHGLLKLAAIKLENFISKSASPKDRCQIWDSSKDCLRKGIDLNDVKAAIRLLGKYERIAKFGIVDLDSLGPPDAPDYIGSYWNQMFISQEDSKINETDPKDNQNIGNWQNAVPNEKTTPPSKSKGLNPDLNDKIERLVYLIEKMEK